MGKQESPLILGETIDYQNYPVESLIISMDWDDDNIDNAHDIFEKYDNKISENQKINWNDFKNEVQEQFGIGYQTVKQIVLAFYKNHQWEDVCYEYAMSFELNTPV